MKKLLSLVCLLVAPLVTVAPAATWYVDNSAGGTNSGTQANPWTSLGSITWGSIVAGDMIYVAPGTGATYGTLTLGASGTAATVAGRIWLVGTGSPAPLLTTCADGNRDYIGLVNLRFAPSGAAITISGQTGWLMQDLTVTGGSQSVILDRGADNTYNIVRGLTVSGLLAQDSTGEFQNDCGGRYNVFEYIKAGVGGDLIDIFGQHNVLRNCFVDRVDNDDIADPDSVNDPHIDVCQTWDAATHAVEWTDLNLIEAVYSNENMASQSHLFVLQGDPDPLGGLIFRFSVIDFTGSRGGGEFQNFSRVRAYNNLIKDSYNLFKPLTSARSNSVRIYEGSSDHDWRNNSFVRSNWTGGGPFSTTSGLTTANNLAYQSGTISGGTGNLNNTDPELTNAADAEGTIALAARNYMPDSDSPCVDGASHQTLAAGAGTNSTALVVDDADFFTDGWGIVEGDLISIGGGPWIRIAAINYGANSITLATADTWADNDPVVVFGSTAIGPYEYRAGGYTLSGTLANPSGNNWTVTANNNDLCRMVIFYENGVPQAPDYDAPFAYTSAGGAVTAKLYARFATEVPVLEATTGGSDVTAPTLQSATVSSSGMQITFAFSEAVTFGAGGNSGWSTNLSGGACTLAYASGSGTTTLVYATSRTVLSGETGTVSYTQPGNGVEDGAGNDLATIGSSSVTNNSTQSIPATPSSPQATSSAGQITLTWDDNSSNETAFVVLRGTSSGSLSEYDTTAANAEVYNDIGVAEGATYYYAVVARNGIGDSSPSSEVSATTPNGPTPTGYRILTY